MVVGYWWLRIVGGGAGDRLCKGGSCKCRRSAIVLVVVVVVLVLVLVVVVVVVMVVVVVVVVLLVVVEFVGYLWWRSGGSGGGDTHCKGDSCNSFRNAIGKVLVVEVVVVVVVMVTEVVVVVKHLVLDKKEPHKINGCMKFIFQFLRHCVPPP